MPDGLFRKPQQATPDIQGLVGAKGGLGGGRPWSSGLNCQPGSAGGRGWVIARRALKTPLRSCRQKSYRQMQRGTEDFVQMIFAASSAV